MSTPSPSYCGLDLAPPLADRFIVEVAPIDYSPALLLKPFGFHFAVDTLPSRTNTRSGSRSALAVSSFRFRARVGFFIPSPLSGPRGITPAFGYSAPHSSARGTLTLLNNALLSTPYGPLRLPDWPPPFLATFGVATPSQSRASLTNPDHLLCMPCSLPRWTGSGARWLASCAFPRGLLPCPCSLPRYRGGSASTSLLSRPAQASHALRPAELLTHHPWALSRGFALAGFPARTLASYQVQPTTSLGGSFPHW